MEKGQNSRDNISKLQERAEAFLNKTPPAVKKVPPQDVKKLVEELHLHQLELEIQNEELRRAQLEIEASRNRYSDLYDFAPVGYITALEKGLIQEANLTICSMLGMERSFLVKSPFSRFISKETRDIFYLHLNRLLETKDRQTCELKLVRKDGTQFHAQLECIVIVDDEGGVTQFRTAVTDISKRKQAERALQESTKEYRSTLNDLLVGVVVHGSDTRILLSNPEASNILGLTYGQMSGKEAVDPAWHFLHEDSTVMKIEDYPVSRVLSTKMLIHNYVLGIKRPDREYITWVIINAIPVFSNGNELEKVIVNFVDITSQKQAEEALRESKERLRIQNQIANIFLTKKDEDMYGEILSVILDIMESKFGVFGYIGQQGELVCPSMTKDIWDQCQLSDKTIVFPEDTWGESIWGNGLRTGLSAYSNKPFKVPEGHIAVDRCLTVPIVYQQKPIGLFTVANKLTDYTESDKQLLEEIAEHVAPVLNARIEKNRSDKALQESEEKLARAEKIEAMGLMVGGVAHDLNNILSGIVSYPELLLMDLPEDSPLRKPIKTIQESGMRAADVVKDLLTIARGVASGKEVLNLNTLTTEYLASAEHQKLERIHPLITFKTELDSDLLNITGSASHVMKILMNLIANASEAIEDKGTVTVSTMNRYLDEPLKGYEDVDTGEYVILTVSDDGSGISPTDLERIFEPFYTKKVMGRSGTGLGLSVVWNSMQDNDGYINVNTSEKGTTFELYFPMTREQIAADKEEVPLDDYIGHGEKVLVVDDEERQREIAGGILTRLGYTAETVSSGEEAIEHIKENAVDLIVLDMVMPKGIDGRETYEEIIKIHPGQKAIIASGYAKTKEVDMAQALGAGKYIMKPYTLAKVGAAVKEELEKE